MKSNFYKNFFLCLYFASMPFEASDPFNTSGWLSISKIVGILYLISIIKEIKFFIKPRLIIIKHFKYLFCFIFLLTFFSVINISEISMKIFDISFIINVVMTFIIIGHAIKEKMILDKAIYWFSLSCVFMTLLTLYGIGVEIDESIGGRVRYFQANENDTAIKISAALLFFLSHILSKSLTIKNKILTLIPIPLLLYVLISTGSRSGIVVLILGVSILLIIMLIKQKNKILGIFYFIFSTSIFVISLIFMIIQSETMITRLLSSINDKDLGGRSEIWKMFYSIISENYIFGIGYSGYIDIFTRTFNSVPSPHNVYIEVLIYTGTIGLICFLIFISNLFILSFKLFKRDQYIAIVLFPVIIGYTFVNQALPIKFFWIVVSYIIGTSILSNINKIRDQ